MPPLSFTHWKYALATLPIVVKSTPGISMSIPPSLIGLPVAFLPVPRPQTDLVADAVPEPTGPAPVAHAVIISARRPQAAHATPILIFVDLIRFSSENLDSFLELNHVPVGAGVAVAPLRSGSRQVRPPCVGCLPEGLASSAQRSA